MPTSADIFAKQLACFLLTLRVAGARIERASSGYEPDEIPLLHPAIFISFSKHCLATKPNRGYSRYCTFWRYRFSTPLYNQLFYILSPFIKF